MKYQVRLVAWAEGEVGSTDAEPIVGPFINVQSSAQRDFPSIVRFDAAVMDGFGDFTVKFDSTESFLSEIALLTNLDAEGGSAPSDEAAENSLRLSTVHQAKGLEWKAVFVLFVNEDMFPSKKSVAESGDAEERRLFYVAVTRAEDELFLCCPMVRRQRDGGMIFLDPSRFLEEIPDDLLQQDGGFC